MGFSGGSGAVVSDNTDFATQQIQQDISILTLQAGASAAASDYDTMFIDIFSDSSGYDNTIDTGAATTAVFSTNLYTNANTAIGTSTYEAHSCALGSSDSLTARLGAKIHANSTFVLTRARKHASSGATTCGLYASNGTTLIKEAAFVGDYATFNEVLTSGTDYKLRADNGGAAYTRQYSALNPGFPFNNTYVNWTAGADQTGADAAYLFNFIGIEWAPQIPSNVKVQTNALTIPTNPVYYQVYGKTAFAGSGAATFDISFDGGTNYVTGQSLNTQYVCSNVGGTMIVKFNLNGAGAGNTSTLSNYGVILWL